MELKFLVQFLRYTAFIHVVCCGGQFLGCIEEEFFLCMCLLPLQAFFIQVGISSLLQLPEMEIDPLQ